MKNEVAWKNWIFN